MPVSRGTCASAPIRGNNLYIASSSGIICQASVYRINDLNGIDEELTFQ